MLVEPIFLLCVEASCSLGCGFPLMAPPYQVLKEPAGETAQSVQGSRPDTEVRDWGWREPEAEAVSGGGLGQDRAWLTSCLEFQRAGKVGAQAGKRQVLKPRP